MNSIRFTYGDINITTGLCVVNNICIKYLLHSSYHSQ